MWNEIMTDNKSKNSNGQTGSGEKRHINDSGRDKVHGNTQTGDDFSRKIDTTSTGPRDPAKKR